jgi:hypothetical protein
MKSNVLTILWICNWKRDEHFHTNSLSCAIFGFIMSAVLNFRINLTFCKKKKSMKEITIVKRNCVLVLHVLKLTYIYILFYFIFLLYISADECSVLR